MDARPPAPAFLLSALLLALLPQLAAGQEGSVTMPLDRWEALSDRLRPDRSAQQPPAMVLQVDRSLEGSFRRGVLSGTLVTGFEVPPGQGHVRVAVIDARATIEKVLLDGRETSLLPQVGPDGRAMYTVGVDQPGRHRVEVRFLQGREDDRFGRRIELALPPAGPTRTSILVPEQEIEPTLKGGVLTRVEDLGQSTRLMGNLDANGLLDLTWRRRPTHEEAAGAARLEADVHTLFTLHEALVRGIAVVDYRVLEGETDRVELRLPNGVEVVDVTGDAVLQWQTEAGGDGRLVVLLRYLVDDAAQVRVHFQFPADLEAAVTLRMPLPPNEVGFKGTLGVQGPAGLQVSTEAVEQAEELTLRDLPAALTDLTPSPLLMGFRFDQEPMVRLDLERNGEVELTSTIIDGIGASTVLIEDGTEITKLRLRLRNNTRQYLGVLLPDEAVLTHALIDGRPVRPALAEGGRLLFPLPQSERIESGGRLYTVQVGDTLSGIASAFYGDSARWSALMEANPGQLASIHDLAPGQALTIPPISAAVRESSFVVELAYKRHGDPLGPLGSRALELPELDVEVVEARWHLYLPQAIEPLSFDANLTQYSDIRYDPFRRVLHFLRQALSVHSAWAGGQGEYSSILSRRKAIYTSEYQQKQGGREVLSSFPLVGERYRFERLLLGADVPRVGFTYMDRDAVPVLRWLGFGAAFGLTLLGFGHRRQKVQAALGFLALLVVAHHVLGVHRRLLWGIDAAMIFVVARDAGPAFARGLGARLARPRSLLDLLSPRNTVAALVLVIAAMFVLSMPLLLSSALLVLLVALHRLVVLPRVAR